MTSPRPLRRTARIARILASAVTSRASTLASAVTSRASTLASAVTPRASTLASAVTSRIARALIVAPTLVLAASTCLPERPAPDGECIIDRNAAIDCRVNDYNNMPADAGLVPYSCSGSVRPDQLPKYPDGVPQGILCSDEGKIGDTGRSAYCCTQQIVDCVYDPVSDCGEPTWGVKCRGGNRPESLNGTLSCSNGLWENEYTNYCCSGNRPPSPCLQTDTLGCPKSMLGFSCKTGNLPTGEDLGPNKSRADYFHPTCSIPKTPPNPELRTYCCFMPALVPRGGTCISHPNLSTCAPGRFAFACYGPDRPEEDNYPMKCDPGVRGTSADGYPATTYCCDYVETGAVTP
ncbi:MAG: hypothetical protein ACOY0T_38365 [Myxococcota bacterium]